MGTDTFRIAATDGTPLAARRWQPEQPAEAVVVLVHGMAEHSGRYGRLAGALTGRGYAVYAYDQRGHGDTADEADHGFFAEQDGWQKVVGDLGTVVGYAREQHPGLPLAVLAHSMGTFVSRTFAATHGARLDALVLTGTGGDQGLAGRAGLAIARAESRLRGPRHTSPLMDKLVFARSNAAFKPTRTDVDWLSRDEAEVDKYIADPKSGNVFTSGFYVDLLQGVAALGHDAALSAMPKDLPVLLASGAADPVGGKAGAGVIEVGDQLRRVGLRDVTVKLYPGARHEVFNELNRDEVTADVADWLDAHLR